MFTIRWATHICGSQYGFKFDQCNNEKLIYLIWRKWYQLFVCFRCKNETYLENFFTKKQPKNKFATEDLDHFLQEKKNFLFLFLQRRRKTTIRFGKNEPTNLIKFFAKQIKPKKNPENNIKKFANTEFYYFSLRGIMVSLLGQNFWLNQEIFAKTSME